MKWSMTSEVMVDHIRSSFLLSKVLWFLFFKTFCSGRIQTLFIWNVILWNLFYEELLTSSKPCLTFKWTTVVLVHFTIWCIFEFYEKQIELLKIVYYIHNIFFVYQLIFSYSIRFGFWLRNTLFQHKLKTVYSLSKTLFLCVFHAYCFTKSITYQIWYSSIDQQDIKG